MTPQDRQEEIDAFIRKKLNAKKAQVFEQRISSDKKLALEVNIQRDIYEALKSQETLDFRKQLNSFREFPKTEMPIVQEAKVRPMQPKAKVRPFGNLLAIAASVLVLVSAGFFTYMSMRSVSPEALFADNIEYPMTIMSSQKGIEDLEGLEKQIKTTWVTADKAYRSENYVTALAELDKIEQLDPDFKIHVQGDYFYKRAIVLLKLNQPNEALTAFDRAIELKTTFSDASWQRTLSLLLLDDKKEQARQALQKFIDEGGAKAKQAKEILEAL